MLVLPQFENISLNNCQLGSTVNLAALLLPLSQGDLCLKKHWSQNIFLMGLQFSFLSTEQTVLFFFTEFSDFYTLFSYFYRLCRDRSSYPMISKFTQEPWGIWRYLGFQKPFEVVDIIIIYCIYVFLQTYSKSARRSFTSLVDFSLSLYSR